MTSEEIREKRRQERKQFKLDRAKALADAAAEADAAFREGREAALPAIPSGATWKPQPSIPDAIPETLPLDEAEDQDASVLEDVEPLEDVEHLQLTIQEAFFLSWGLDCLTILEPSTVCCLSFHFFHTIIMTTCMTRTSLCLFRVYGHHSNKFTTRYHLILHMERASTILSSFTMSHTTTSAH